MHRFRRSNRDFAGSFSRWPLLLALMTILGVSTSARGQVKLNEVDYSGKIVKLSQTLFTVSTQDGQIIYASIDPLRVGPGGIPYTGIPKPHLELVGTETLDYLKRGMAIRFVAEVQEGKRVEGTLSEVTVFSDTVKPLFGLFPLQDDAKEINADAKPAAVPRHLQTGRFFVVGQISAYRRDELMVKAGRVVLRAKLADEAIVNLAYKHPRFARVGDAIRVQGLMAQPPFVFATKVEVTRNADLMTKSNSNRKPKDTDAREEKSRRPDPFAVGARPADDPPKGDSPEEKGSEINNTAPKRASALKPGKLIRIN